MLRMVGHLLLVLPLAAGCTSEWQLDDLDGDGFTIADGDCWDSPESPEGSTLTGADIFPGQTEAWYDGIDQDCGDDDDFDADLDGFVSDDHVGRPTLGVDGSGALPGGDCWDNPDVVPDLMTDYQGLYAADGAYGALGIAAPVAAEVNPAQEEDLPYDGMDVDCAGLDADGNGAEDDFDVDLDGYASSAWANRSGVFGDDCIDCEEGSEDQPACLAEANASGARPADVNPAALEIWYDGTDDNCDANDCDQDGDGFDGPSEGESEDFCLPDDCDDLDADRKPDGSEEIYFNGIDDNCDLTDRDGDEDGDTYWSVDYADLCAANGAEPLTVPVGKEGDCIDEPGAQASINGFDDVDHADINPGATERFYDGVDQDCLGEDSNADGANDDLDWDGDGFATEHALDSGGTTAGDDCSDCSIDCIDSSCAEWSICQAEPANPAGLAAASINVDAFEIYYDESDSDCGGYDGNGDGAWDDYDQDSDAYEELSSTSGVGTDCDDEDPLVNPGVNEECATSYDDDCDGGINDAGANDCLTWYLDSDGDGEGDLAVTECTCTANTSYVSNATDCDDGDATVGKNATEICDGQINDCDTSSLPSNESDDDSDGYVECVYSSSTWVGSGSVVGGEDCDDGDAVVYPTASEICDGQYNDCDDTAYSSTSAPSDETDNDGDSVVECAYNASTWVGSGSVTDGGDCDDGENTVYPGATERCDGQYNDCDDPDYSASAAPDDETDDDGDAYVECEIDSGGWDGSAISGGDDCDDTDATVYYGASEVCDGQINNCATSTLPSNESDDDSDGYVECTYSSSTWVGSGSVVGGDDCDDGDDERSPGLTEVCDDEDKDEDCDELSDDDDTSVDTSTYTTWNLDSDGDGHITSAPTTSQACDEPTATSPAQYLADGTESSSNDCDDADADINPDADEICDASSTDEDCNGVADDADSGVDTSTQTLFYVDSDSDGYGDEHDGGTLYCHGPSGYSSDNTDCEDGDTNINPGETEVCDASDTDEDCSGLADDDDPDVDSGTFSTFYADTDSDSFGDAASTTEACDVPSGYVTNDTDCDDDDASINPLGSEICDASNADEDCDGLADDDDSSATGQTDWYTDVDGDGYTPDSSTYQTLCDSPTPSAEYFTSNSTPADEDCDDGDEDVNPGAEEVCYDGIDNDCDSAVTCEIDPDLGNANFLAQGSAATSGLGSSVLLADLSGDGTLDVLTGASAEDTYTGAIYMVLGPTSATAPVSATSTLSQDSRDFSSSSDYDAKVTGISTATYFGSSLALAGDVDDDGYDDLLVGAYYGDEGVSNGGDVYLFQGPLGADFAVTSDDADGFYFGVTSGSPGGLVGTSLVGAFDFNDDGYDDFAMGAPGNEAGSSAGNTGMAYVFFGGTSAPANGDVTTADVVISGTGTDDFVGYSLAAGDFDGDGVDDLATGAPYYDDALTNDGKVFVMLGSSAPSAAIDLSTDADATYTGGVAGDRLGWAVHMGFDLDGDGYGDLAMGADAFDTSVNNAGGVFVMLGGAAPAAATTLTSSTADLTFTGDAANDLAGRRIASADMDGDLQDDLLILVESNDDGGSQFGSIAMFYGPLSSGTTAAASADLSVYGEAANDLRAGRMSTGDINADGWDDLLVGASDTSKGTAYLLLGVGG